MRETPSSCRSNGSSRRCRTRLAEVPNGSVEAGVEARFRLPAQGLLDLPRVDHRTTLLPGQGRAVLLGLAASGQSLQRLEDGVDVGLDAGANVERADGVRVEGAGVRLRYVADVNEIAGLLAVAVDAGLLSAQQPAREDRDHAGLTVRVLSRPVDIGIAQGRVRQPMQSVERSQVHLRRQLSGAVG